MSVRSIYPAAKKSNRFALLYGFLCYYIVLSFAVRVALSCLSEINFGSDFLELARGFGVGFLYDCTVAAAFCIVYSLYLLLWPAKWIGSLADKILTWVILLFMLFISLFAFMAEFPFWDEFKSRFNFIAVDYLIYTYEVVQNINESYPMPILITALLVFCGVVVYLFSRIGLFKDAFSAKVTLRGRIVPVILLWTVAAVGLFGLKNSHSEISANSYLNEISKNGVFSFFAAFKNNELDYTRFYATLPTAQAYSITKQNLLLPGETWAHPQNTTNITRIVRDSAEQSPNIVVICIESFSAEFMSAFGNTQHLTPNIDALAEQGTFFKNVFATGTRTVRGMEALTLCVPPTPGNSIVRRQNNDHLFSVGTVVRQKNYKPYFIYGGDGYFDNMNAFFGGQGFTIVDRNRGNPLPENISTQRLAIEDEAVHFENAWGISDEDIYAQALEHADAEANKGQKFFQFIMTTSNHKPYTFPDGKIDMPSGTREAAVKYTDYAVGKFIREAAKKPWFANTVFLLVADHCASSAGKWEINTEKHHIPAILFGAGIPVQNVDRLTSQIDLMPTLFGLLHWSYPNAFYGRDIFKVVPGTERAYIGNYRTLGVLQNNVFTQINDRKKIQQFQFNPTTKTITESQKVPLPTLQQLTVALYQSASERFSSGLMKENKN